MRREAGGMRGIDFRGSTRKAVVYFQSAQKNRADHVVVTTWSALKKQKLENGMISGDRHHSRHHRLRVVGNHRLLRHRRVHHHYAAAWVGLRSL